MRENINKIENKNRLLFYNLKIITALRNQNIDIIHSYNIDYLTRNAGNCLFKMLENKSSMFSNLTDKMWKLSFLNCGLYSKNRKVGFKS